MYILCPFILMQCSEWFIVVFPKRSSIHMSLKGPNLLSLRLLSIHEHFGPNEGRGIFIGDTTNAMWV